MKQQQALADEDKPVAYVVRAPEFPEGFEQAEKLVVVSDARPHRKHSLQAFNGFVQICPPTEKEQHVELRRIVQCLLDGQDVRVHIC